MKKLIILLILIMSLTSCLKNKDVVKYNFWKNKTQKIGICVCNKPKTISLDSIESKDASFYKYLKKMNFNGFSFFAMDVAKGLNKLGYNSVEFSYYDYGLRCKKSTFANMTIGAAIIFNLHSVELESEYNKEQNIINSYVILRIRPTIKKTFEGESCGEVNIFPEGDVISKIQIEGDWNQPSNYPNITEALNKAIDKTKEQILGNIFQNVPGILTDKKPKVGVCVAVKNQYYENPRKRLFIKLHNKDYFQYKAFIENADFTYFTGISSKIVQKLIDRGYNAEEIPYVEPAYMDKSIVDYSPVIKNKNVDVLICYEISNINVYGKTDKKKNKYDSYLALKVSLISREKENMKENYIFGDENKEFKVPVEGEWNQPPDYPGLKKSLNQAMINAKEYYSTNLFKNAPKLK